VTDHLREKRQGVALRAVALGCAGTTPSARFRHSASITNATKAAAVISPEARRGEASEGLALVAIASTSTN
jgi:hypothetical protein